MLVSAAIEPYKKSNGNSLSSAAIAGGNAASDRMTASPRNTCVPGVQACATPGATMSVARAMSAQRRSGRLGDRRLVVSDPKPLSLPFDGAPQILQLGLHRIVDCLARMADVIRDLLAQVLATLPQVLAAVGSPSGAG